MGTHSMITFSIVPPALIPVIWEKIQPYLKPVADVSSGDLTEESIFKDMRNGENVVVVIIDDYRIIGVNTLQVHTFNSGLKCLYIPIIGGERIDEWGEEFFCMCKEIAKQNGCTELRGMAARGGWLRKLKQHDLHWQSCYEVIKYDLTGDADG
jgi:hypothetical protein